MWVADRAESSYVGEMATSEATKSARPTPQPQTPARQRTTARKTACRQQWSWRGPGMIASASPARQSQRIWGFRGPADNTRGSDPGKHTAQPRQMQPSKISPADTQSQYQQPMGGEIFMAADYKSRYNSGLLLAVQAACFTSSTHRAKRTRLYRQRQKSPAGVSPRAGLIKRGPQPLPGLGLRIGLGYLRGDHRRASITAFYRR